MSKLHMQRIKGFTLIEVMIVVVIIAILAMIAMPSYQEQIRKSRRAIAKAELLKVQSRQEQYFTNNKSYATTLTALGYPASPYYIDDNGQAGTTSSGNGYQLAISGASATAFTITATPNQTDANCGNLAINQNGTATESGSRDLAYCW